MMTFEEAFERLNHGDFAGVAEEMVTWHPAILGAMLQAVAVAKHQRYPLLHRDYDIGVRAVLRSVGQTVEERIEEIKEEGGRD